MKINLQLSSHEAYLVASCLEFISKNLVYDENSGSRRFVGGGRFELMTEDFFDINYLSAKLDELRQDSANYVCYNPYVKFF